MTTAAIDRAVEEVAAHRAAYSYGHRLVDDLVAQNLARPSTTTVRVDQGELVLVLTLSDRDEMRAWHAHLDTTDLEPHGPYRTGPRSVIALVGRLSGVAAVLELEVDHETPAEPGAIPPAPASQASPTYDGAAASERTADHDTAGWRAAIEAAAAVADRINRHVTSTADGAR